MPRDHRDYVLYRMFGYDGRLLYVGKTMCETPEFRLSQHRAQKHWWSEVADIKLERHANEEALGKAEVVAINTEKPRYNRRFELSRPLVPQAPDAKATQKEATRRRKRMNHEATWTFDRLRRRGGAGSTTSVEQHKEWAREAGVSEEDIEWAEAHPIYWTDRMSETERAARFAEAGVYDEPRDEMARRLYGIEIGRFASDYPSDVRD